jgi:HTH-type transcriptional regulator, competence development regulator
MVRDLASIIGERVRGIRQAKGISQEQLGVQAGLTGRTVRRIEQGEDFTFSSLTAIAAVLDVDVTDLLSDDIPAA